MKGLIVYSGGMDSTVLLNDYKDEISMAINFQYGSKHNLRELVFARYNCDKLNIPLHIINLDFTLFKSNLLSEQGEIPKGHYEDESMKKTIVPFRNGIMLSYAAGLAESNNLDIVLIANHFGDHAIYPDCTLDFVSSMKEAIVYGTTNDINIIAPYTEINKRDVALRGKELGVDFYMTYSCYNGGDTHCGECGTCVERKEALQGFDNTEYLK